MLIELRVLRGPNADIPGPAIRVTLEQPSEPDLDLADVVHPADVGVRHLTRGADLVPTHRERRGPGLRGRRADVDPA